jgi:hypothetical protein
MGEIEIKEEAPLYEVVFALLVQGEGLVAHCCFPDPRKVRINAGDPIEFVRPNGRILRTNVKAIGLITDGHPGLIGLVLPDEIEKDELPRITYLRLLAANNPQVS